jgi:hypothetical protein
MANDAADDLVNLKGYLPSLHLEVVVSQQVLG